MLACFFVAAAAGRPTDRRLAQIVARATAEYVQSINQRSVADQFFVCVCWHVAR